jgi:Transmembrane secretion effector
MPDSARGRISALMMVLSQGAMTLGAVVWGLSAEIAGTRFTLLAAAFSLCLGSFADAAF